jgi:archaellum component FlaG (FlaF/FlaG flagellin family)
VVASFGVEVTSHFVLFIVALVCTGTTVGRIGNLHKATAVQ